MRTSRVLGARAVSSQAINPIGDDFKMRGTDAPLMTAQMVNSQSGRHEAFGNPVSKPVSEIVLAINPHAAVPISSHRPAIFPTIAPGPDTQPKPLLWR